MTAPLKAAHPDQPGPRSGAGRGGFTPVLMLDAELAAPLPAIPGTGRPGRAWVLGAAAHRAGRVLRDPPRTPTG